MKRRQTKMKTLYFFCCTRRNPRTTEKKEEKNMAIKVFKTMRWHRSCIVLVKLLAVLCMAAINFDVFDHNCYHTIRFINAEDPDVEIELELEPEPTPSVTILPPVRHAEQQRPQQDETSHPPVDTGTANPRRLDTTRLAPFDKDIREDCRSIQLHCTSDVFAHVFLQCPYTCSSLLEEEGMKGTVPSGTEEFLIEGSLRTRHGDTIDTDRFEGSVILAGIVPLLPGMAVYYYEMMEHLHSVFGIKGCEFVIIPIDHELGIHIKERGDGGEMQFTREDTRTNNRQNKKKQGVLVLEEQPISIIEKHPWVKHLMSVKPRSGAALRDSIIDDDDDEVGQTQQDDTATSGITAVSQTPLHTDRVTFYIVSADGYFVERVISPSLATLRKKVATYLRTVDYDEL